MRRNGGSIYWTAALVCAVLALAARQPAALGAPSAGAGDAAQSAFPQSVTDPRGRFTMTFPSGWNVATRAEGMVALVAGGPVNGRRLTLNVTVEPLPHPMDPPAYAAAAERLLKVAFHNYTVVQESGATVGGRPAYYRYFTWETNTGVSLYQLQVFVTDNVTGFVLTGSTVNDRDRILNDMPVVVRIIDTFRVGAPRN